MGPLLGLPLGLLLGLMLKLLLGLLGCTTHVHHVPGPILRHSCKNDT